MGSRSIESILSFAGTFVELGMCVLLTALVLGLRRQARQYRYFEYWSWGWIVLCAAIGAVVVRYAVGGLAGGAVPGPERSPAVIALYLAYQFGKLLFLLFVGAGVWSYRHPGPIPRRAWLVGVSAAAVYSIGSVLWAPDLDRVVMLQAVVAVPIFAAAAWQIGSIPPRRGELGLRVLGGTLVGLAALWTFYFLGFARPHPAATGPWAAFLTVLTGNNSFFDAGLLVLLGIGMVLTLVEHSHQDAEAVHLRQIQDMTAARSRLSQTIEAAHDGIVTLDGDRRIEDLNEAAVAVLGADRSAARGRPLDDFIQADDRAGVWSAPAAAVRRSEARPAVATRREVRGLRPDGAEFPLEVALSSYGDGGPRGYVAVIRDLTDKRRVEADEERLQQQLAQTARLETVGRMVSGVAHELNNPLTAIIAFAQDLLLSPRSEEDREALTVLMQQAQRCRVIVGDLLIFARSKRDERRRVAPAELVSRVARVFERDSSRSGVRFEIDVADDLPPVDIDAVGIEQVLANLLTNAFQAAPQGGLVELRVRADGDRLEVVVQDDGAGIAADAMPRLFEPFYTTKAPGQGTGLGLSVSHAIVEQHGGTIEAENRRDRPSGARFIVRLPFVNRRSRGPGAEDFPDRGAAPAVAADRPRARRVLVIDDEAAIRTAIRRALERRGWEVDEAGDGQEATMLLEVGGRLADYDAVVTDLRMPGMSGVELYHWLQLKHPSAISRVIVVTGDTASPAVAEFLASLEGPYLQKPFDMRALLDVLDRITAAA